MLDIDKHIISAQEITKNDYLSITLKKMFKESLLYYSRNTNSFSLESILYWKGLLFSDYFLVEPLTLQLWS